MIDQDQMRFAETDNQILLLRAQRKNKTDLNLQNKSDTSISIHLHGDANSS